MNLGIPSIHRLEKARTMRSPTRRRSRLLAAATGIALLVGFGTSVVSAGVASASPAETTSSVQLVAAKSVAVPDMVGKSGKTAERMLKSIGLKWKWKAPKYEFVLLASNWKVTAQSPAAGATLAAGKKVKLTVVKKVTSGSSSSSSSSDTTPTFATQSYSGSGDNVQAVNLTQPAIVTFSCPGCSENTTLESNGPDSLIVNEIGAYSGSHLINTSSGALTTQFIIGADAAWTITVSDLTTAKTFTGAATGTGDQVIKMTGTFSDVALHNDGAENFVVESYGNGDWDPLVANEIGAYAGTVPMTGPTYVDVESSGNWSITPAD